jgi:hypothetical protein
MELPKGVNMHVPNLGQLVKPEKPLIAITIKPGDRVMVLLPQTASQQEVAQVQQYLKNWAPGTEFLVLSGPESIVVIPPTVTHTDDDVVAIGDTASYALGDPVEDKAPQGLDGKLSELEARYAQLKAKEAAMPQDVENPKTAI